MFVNSLNGRYLVAIAVINFICYLTGPYGVSNTRQLNQLTHSRVKQQG